jgi:hypothetical protein
MGLSMSLLRLIGERGTRRHSLRPARAIPGWLPSSGSAIPRVARGPADLRATRALAYESYHW